MNNFWFVTAVIAYCLSMHVLTYGIKLKHCYLKSSSFLLMSSFCLRHRLLGQHVGHSETFTMKPETGWNKPEGWIKFTRTFAEVFKSGLNLQPVCAHLLCIERTTRNVLVLYGFSLQSFHTTGDFSKSWTLLAQTPVEVNWGLCKVT